MKTAGPFSGLSCFRRRAMSDFYQNYTEGPSNNPNSGDRGTAPMVLGLISLICSLTFSRLAGIILGIIAVCLSSGIRKENSQANAGFIMGILGICIAAVIFFSLLFLALPVISGILFF